MVSSLTAKEIRMLRQTATETHDCKVRRCEDPGTYYMGRMTPLQHLRTGLYCDSHDRQFGSENLQRWAEQIGGRVITLSDSEGEYEGVTLEAAPVRG